jgi:hypothetical protein
MLGRIIQIGKSHADKGMYDQLVGCTGVVVYIGDNQNVLVRLTEVNDVKLLNYVDEKFLIHLDDCQLLDSFRPEFSESGYEDLAFGQIIQIGGNGAKQLDYEAAVGHEAVVEYKMDAFACVAITTGPMAGEIRDILKEDCQCIAPVAQDNHLIVINHSQGLILYTEASELRLFKHVRGSLSDDRTETHTGQLSDFIERHDYKIVSMIETEAAKELMKNKQTGGGSESLATQSPQESE